MSHIATVSVEIKSIHALGEACKRLGCQLVLNQKTAKFYANQTQDCAHAIKIPGTSWEVAVIDNGDGTFKLGFDGYGREGKVITKLLGDGLKGLSQEYAAQVVESQLKAKGLRYTRSINKQGAVVIVANS